MTAFWKFAFPSASTEKISARVTPNAILEKAVQLLRNQTILVAENNVEDKTNTVPIRLKMTLTGREAAEYSNISINKIDSMLRVPNCLFVLFVGTKKLVKHRELEQYISRTTAI